MKIELEYPDKDPHVELATKSLSGLHIFYSIFCPDHKVGLIVVRPQDHEVDVQCILDALEETAKKVFEAHLHATRKAAKEN